MARKLTTIMVLASLALAGAAIADNKDDATNQLFSARTLEARHQVPAAVTGMSKASGDTIYLIGGPGRLDGRFETAAGTPSWQGWSHEDFTTEADVTPWHVSSERVLDGAYSMVCGEDVLTAGGLEFGYGNDWKTALVFTHAVTDPSVASVVHFTGTMRVDAEPGYDYVYLEVHRANGWTTIDDSAVWDGTGVYNLDFTTTITSADYYGPGLNEIQLRFYFESDGGWSDEDGFFNSDGPVWLDDLRVEVAGALADFEDFEDGQSQHWNQEVIVGVGDFAQLYTNLQDLDPCRSNHSVQVAFVDDGLVVPGTGGSPGQTWRYGPGGYVVNTNGGLLGPDYYIENGVVSQPLQWIDGHDAADLVFGVYMHEPMSQQSGGTMYLWWVRSTTSDDPAMLEFESWTNDLTVWYGPPVYNNHRIDLSSYLEPGRKWFQIRLEVWEAGWLFGVTGSDATPHPYFDNVRVLSYPYGGPAINYDPLFIAQDNFPELGALDFTNLVNNSIRFDMARNISPTAHLRNDPGDSLFVDVVPVRAGSVLGDLPRMVVRMKGNPVFHGVRQLPPGFTRTGDIITGAVTGDSTYTAQGTLVGDRYHFDLPDTGFFYPGDVIHYYFEAWDNLAGDIGHTMLPGDTTGFASFHHDLNYPSDFICRGLPSLRSTTPGDQPHVLFWNDFADRGGENEWLYALNGAGLSEGLDYDVYYTNAPDAGEGNGLGGRATSVVMSGYDILLYTCGNSLAYTLGNGDVRSDPSRDLQLLNAWFDHGGKKAFLTGDDLAFDLTQKGSEGQAFLSNVLSVQLINRQINSLVNNQVAPMVQAANNNGFIETVDRWVAFGGCLLINTFDAIETIGGSTRLAEFTNPQGQAGVYPYAAAVYNHIDSNGAEIVMMPYDFMYIYNAPGYIPPAGYEGLAARSLILRDLLSAFGMPLEAPIGVDLPDARPLDLAVYPNPFNPTATLALSMPRAGKASLKIFNVRGELVHTVFDGELTAGRHELTWDGRDGTGARAASGVYFAEVRTLGEMRVKRMAMVK
ncbi:MAG: FlgD immunoglobulin-like domain containing protein [Candidatus Krumholzibacteriia bacterium]